MIKKAVLVLVLLFLVIVIGIFIFERQQTAKISNVLSERSKEFIKRQEAQDQSQFSSLIGEKGEDFKGKRVGVGDCFSFIMPYSVFNHREEGECSGYFAFERPKGSIVAFMEEAESSSIDYASGVSMRRQESEKYEEKVFDIGGKSYTGFIDKTDIYSITIYHFVSGKYFIFTLKLSEENDKILREILGSLEFY